MVNWSLICANWANSHFWVQATLEVLGNGPEWHPVWLDDGMKSSQIVSKSWQKVVRASFYIKRELYVNSPKNTQNVWATFVRYFLPRIFKNWPIWSH